MNRREFMERTIAVAAAASMPAEGLAFDAVATFDIPPNPGFYQGTTLPGNEFGQRGDLFYNVISGTLFSKGDDDVWGFVGSLLKE